MLCLMSNDLFTLRCSEQMIIAGFVCKRAEDSRLNHFISESKILADKELFYKSCLLYSAKLFPSLI